MMKRTIVVVLFATLALGCARAGSGPRATAEAFLDAHYVRIDLPAAVEFVSGLARDKIDKEIALTKGQEIDHSTQQPRVSYKLQRADESEASAQYAFQLTVRPPGADPFKKLVMVTVRSADGKWSVTNYSEGEATSDGGA